VQVCRNAFLTHTHTQRQQQQQHERLLYNDADIIKLFQWWNESFLSKKFCRKLALAGTIAAAAATSEHVPKFQN